MIQREGSSWCAPPLTLVNKRCNSMNCGDNSGMVPWDHDRHVAPPFKNC